MKNNLNIEGASQYKLAQHTDFNGTCAFQVKRQEITRLKKGSVTLEQQARSLVQMLQILC